jgi:hypothetical protein
VSILDFFKSKEKIHEKEILDYFQNGWFSDEISKDKILLPGFVYHIKSLEKSGFDYKKIVEIGILAQIDSNLESLEKVKKELLEGKFHEGLDSGEFDVLKDYINLSQIVLENGEVYVVAESSPADYIGTFVGTLWKVKLPNRISVGEVPKTSLVFRKS